jgi:hypothetical protein
MKKRWIFSSVMLFMMGIALMGCAPQTVVVTVIITATPQPTLAIQTATQPAATVVVNTATAANLTPTPSPAAATSTSTLTPTPAATLNVPVFDYCATKKNPTLCITSFGLVSNQTMYMIFQYLNNDKSEKYYVMYDNAKYDCPQVTSLPDLYNCLGLPSAVNRTVSVQLFKAAGDVLVAQGSIYINQTYLYTYTPTPTNTPTPTATLTPTPSNTAPTATPSKTP